MTRTSTFTARRACLVALVPLTLALSAGTAAAEPAAPAGTSAPAADITTNPNAQNHDPVQNGAALGGGIGAVFGMLQGLTGFVFIPITVPLETAIDGVAGAGLGALVGIFFPDAVPQVLP